MMKELIKSAGLKLLKIDWVKREVEAYMRKLRNRRYYEKWAQLMHSGGKVRIHRPSKLAFLEAAVIYSRRVGLRIGPIR